MGQKKKSENSDQREIKSDYAINLKHNSVGGGDDLGEWHWNTYNII